MAILDTTTVKENACFNVNLKKKQEVVKDLRKRDMGWEEDMPT